MNLSVYLIAGVFQICFSDITYINEPVSVFDCRCFSDKELTLMNQNHNPEKPCKYCMIYDSFYLIGQFEFHEDTEHEQ